MSEKKNIRAKNRTSFMFRVTALLITFVLTVGSFILIGVLTDHFLIAALAAAAILAVSIVILHFVAKKFTESNREKVSEYQAAVIVNVAEQLKPTIIP